MALGMFDQASYTTGLATIEPGDTLVLFSDGITEAENVSGRPFDDAGLEAVVAANADRDPEALGRKILDAVTAHAGDVRLADDLTTLVLKRG
jgi:sigma-B regulation protein RsbU (phosphoserine phosphatase)